MKTSLRNLHNNIIFEVLSYIQIIDRYYSLQKDNTYNQRNKQVKSDMVLTRYRINYK